MRTEDYRKRNYRAYKEIHKNCDVNKEKMKEMTITECVEIYMDVVNHLQLKTTTARCKAIIKMFRNNMVTNKWNETSDYDVKRMCREVFTNGGYCDATIKQMVCIVFSSIRLVKEIINDAHENSKDNNKNNVMEKRDMSDMNNNTRIRIINSRNAITVDDVKAGQCFMFKGADEKLYMKLSRIANSTEDSKNIVCLNNGVTQCLKYKKEVVLVEIDIVAKVIG